LYIRVSAQLLFFILAFFFPLMGTQTLR